MEERESRRLESNRPEPDPPIHPPTPRMDEVQPSQSAHTEPLDPPRGTLSTPMDADEPSYDNVDEDLIDEDVLAEMLAEDQPDDGPSAHQYGMDIDMLLSLGVSPIDATRFVRKCMAVSSTATFVEAYGRGGLSEMAKSMNLNIQGLHALDFVNTKADGSSWDFSKSADRVEARNLVKRDQPDWIIGSPPCTAFSVLNIGMNFPRMDPGEVERRVTEGLVHLKFVCQLYRHQRKHGRWFLHEHPSNALSWKAKPIRRMLKLMGVDTTVNHQCMFGLTTRGPNGDFLPVKKPTRRMSNSIWMLEYLAGKCD